MIILMWILASYGMTTILVYGSIFNGLRNWIHRNAEPNIGWVIFTPVFKFISGLIQCMLCTSTWVGFFMSICLGGLTTRILDTHWAPSIFFDGLATCGMVWAINGIIEFFEESRIK